MNELINTPLFTITLTVVVYLLSDYLYIKTKCAFLNPVMTSIVILIIGLKFNDIDFKTYDKGTYIIKLLLNASVVALAYPLYLQWDLIKKNYKKILLCMFLGSSIGIISVVLLAILFGASDQVILSLIPKSITTPIAVKVSESIGGIAPLSAAVVIMVGIFGSVVGVNFLKLMKINKPESVGLAMGTAAHGLGTATVAKLGNNYSAMAGLAIALNGLLTAILSPLFVEYILKYIH
ncbi:MAG: LrgB family protein [Marinifilaceae bacterium]|jgi:predicted murein hydrolase (TIGR00659 family)|nr:LrgB family protein [Marinifilaceae bacterium]